MHIFYKLYGAVTIKLSVIYNFMLTEEFICRISKVGKLTFSG